MSSTTTATTAMSLIPTATGYIRSPDTRSDGIACIVIPNGNVYGGSNAYYSSYGRSSPYLDNANFENCRCVTAEYEEFYGYVGLGDLRHNSYGNRRACHLGVIPYSLLA